MKKPTIHIQTQQFNCQSIHYYHDLVMSSNLKTSKQDQFKNSIEFDAKNYPMPIKLKICQPLYHVTALVSVGYGLKRS